MFVTFTSNVNPIENCRHPFRYNEETCPELDRDYFRCYKQYIKLYSARIRWYKH